MSNQLSWRRRAPWLLLPALCWAGVALTAPDAIDSDLMQALEDHNTELASNLAQADAKAADTNAAEMLKLLQQVQAFYTARGDAPDAVAVSAQGLQLAARIRQQVATRQFEAAAGTATDLSRSCKSCHNVYKKPR